MSGCLRYAQYSTTPIWSWPECGCTTPPRSVKMSAQSADAPRWASLRPTTRNPFWQWALIASATRPPQICARLDGVQEICRILASGCNVVSSSPVAFVHPKSCPAEVHDQLVDAACRGGASLFISGIDPGFLDDVLPLTLTALCGRWRELRVIEILNYATYDRQEALFDAMGFGQPLNQTPMLLTAGVLEFTWGGALHLLAEGLGLTLDGLDSSYEKRPAERPLRIGTCTVEAGTLAALRFEIRGIVAGRAPLVIEHVTRLDDDLAPDWPSGSGSYRVILTGEPTIRCEVEFEDAHGDHTVGAVLATATRIVNAIPNVCRSAPGFLSALDLPAVTGGGLYRG